MSRPQNNKKNNSRVQNTFETAFEKTLDFGKSAAKDVVDTFNPLSGVFETPNKSTPEKKGDNHSQLDFQKLQEAYAKQDQEAIREQQELLNPEMAEEQTEKQEEMQAHRRYKREEEEYYAKRDQEEEEERQEALEEQEKQRQEEEERRRIQQQEEPRGKVRKSILGGGKPKAQTNLPPEMKPGRGSN